MNLKTFFKHFDTLAEAPNGIQRLRELILDMAVRGKLVPQDPEDEPAEKILRRVQNKKKKLIALGEVPKPQKIAKDLNKEAPFILPSGWIWTCLDDVSSYIQRGKSPKYNDFGKVYVISQKCIQWKGFDLSKARYIQDNTISSCGKERFLVPGDVLWNSTGTGTVGRVCALPETFTDKTMVADSHVTVIRPIECYSRFIYCWLASPFIQETIEDKTSGTTKQQELNTSTVRLEPVPLPPLAEQKRIVAKVDELMALCDALEAAQQTRNTLRQKLRASALDGLMNAPNNTDLETAWAFVRDNWGLMCDRPEDVEGLRQGVLQMSVRGKLEPQASSDESAHQLLDKIRKNRIKLGGKTSRLKACSFQNINGHLD